MNSILFVDDDDDEHLFFSQALKEIDLPVKSHFVYDGEEALKYLSEAEALPDFIFLDRYMPRMDGKTCLIEIKNTPHLAHIKVIIYSSGLTEDVKEEYLKLGASCLISKAYEPHRTCRQILHIITGEYLLKPDRVI